MENIQKTKSATKTDSKSNKTIEDVLFSALSVDGKHLNKWDLLDALERAGILQDDPRFKELFLKLNSKDGDLKAINSKKFKTLISENKINFQKAIQGDQIVPDFEAFSKEIQKIYNDAKKNNGGKVADYIPQLKKVLPNKFGISICSIDGQRFSIGDHSEYFSIQSVSKPINYCLALEENGGDFVHNHVGREPSGVGFNEITFDKRKRPHNPMINAGAIMTSSLIKNKLDPASRFDYVIDMWRRLCGGHMPHFNNAVYLSERGAADRNFALAYLMQENKRFPENTNLEKTLEFYFQCCSIELSSDALSIAASTLANGGTCPFTGDRVFGNEAVKFCLSLMSSCGMYDFSGEFAFSIGLPAKSGDGGGLMIVIPKVMGISVWSPPLDENGNSVRGIEVCSKLVSRYNFHNFDCLTQATGQKIDPTHVKNQSKIDGVIALCWAAANGDLKEIQRLVAKGVKLDEADYDGRCALHLAAAEGQEKVIKYLIDKKIYLHPKDRWGHTPLMEAKRANNKEIIELFNKHGQIH